MRGSRHDLPFRSGVSRETVWHSACHHHETTVIRVEDRSIIQVMVLLAEFSNEGIVNVTI